MVVYSFGPWMSIRDARRKQDLSAKLLLDPADNGQILRGRLQSRREAQGFGSQSQMSPGAGAEG